MKLALTSEQSAQIAPHLRHGFALLGRVTREPFDGTNATTAGTLTIEVGSVPECSLPALRDAIRKALWPVAAKAKRSRREHAPA